MKATLKKIITTLYPELTGGYHLPMKAEVIAIADAPTQPEISTDYRPYYAVDVMPLTPKGDPNNAIGPLLGLPLPVNVYHFPEIGQRVEIAFFKWFTQSTLYPYGVNRKHHDTQTRPR